MLPTSPRRRAFVVGVVALVVALALVVAIALNRGEQAGSAVPQDSPGTVLLVPGYGGSTTSLEALAATLRSRGRVAVVVASPGNGTGDLREHARALDVAAQAAVAGGAPSVDVVGFSAGGVVARVWVAELGGGSSARRVVTLGSPHHGTDLAGTAAALAPGSCPMACRQLVPDGELLGDLDETPDGPLWTSLWTAQDEVVTPPDSAELAGAVNVELQMVCADAQVTHGQLPTDPLAVAVVLQALGVPPLLEAPGPADCAGLRAGLSS